MCLSVSVCVHERGGCLTLPLLIAAVATPASVHVVSRAECVAIGVFFCGSAGCRAGLGRGVRGVCVERAIGGVKWPRCY